MALIVQSPVTAGTDIHLHSQKTDDVYDENVKVRPQLTRMKRELPMESTHMPSPM